jgi:hypothetical protein
MGTYANHQTLKCIREVQIHNHPSIAFEAQRDVVTLHLVIQHHKKKHSQVYKKEMCTIPKLIKDLSPKLLANHSLIKEFQ